MSHEEIRCLARQARAAIAAGILAGICVLAAACSGTTGQAHRHAGHDHGTIVASLPIPFSPPRVPGTPDVMTVTVTAGELFSLKVTTSDGPFYWAPAGRPPDPGLIRDVGDFNDGHCARLMPGCRVPYFATYAARQRGTATMTWAFHQLGCPATASPASPGPAGPSCPRIILVTFRITVVQ